MSRARLSDLLSQLILSFSILSKYQYQILPVSVPDLTTRLPASALSVRSTPVSVIVSSDSLQVSHLHSDLDPLPLKLMLNIGKFCPDLTAFLWRERARCREIIPRSCIIKSRSPSCSITQLGSWDFPSTIAHSLSWSEFLGVPNTVDSVYVHVDRD